MTSLSSPLSIRKLLWFCLAIGLALFQLGRVEDLARPGRFNLLVWDAAGYYGYLPAVFIHHDLGFGWSEKESGVPADHFVKQAGQYRLNRYPVGPALLQLPFFLGAHGVALAGDEPANGYSRPYRQGILLGAAFYAMAGLFLLGLTLRRWFSGASVLLTLLCLGLGTNLTYYSLYEGMMSHVYSFFLFCLVLWSGVRWREDGSQGAFLLMALAGGFVAATRISNVVILLVPLLWGLGQGLTLRQWWTDIRALQWRIGAGAVLFLLPLLPQMAYLHHVTGQVVFPTYGEEGFFWSDPLVGKVLFSFRKGWMVWSPLIALGLLGWYRLRHLRGFWAMNLFWVLNLYIVSSWWCWWYGGGFGMRALIESSAVMAFGMAAFLEWMGRHSVRSHVLAVVLPWFLALNMLQNHQYSRGIIHWEAMSREAWLAVFGHVNPAPRWVMDRRDAHLAYPDYGKAQKDKAYRRSL